MQVTGHGLHPPGIVAFEFSGSASAAQTTLESWAQRGVIPQLYFALGFDYVFMVSYASFLWLACRMISASLTGWTSTAMMIIALAQPVAALLDGVENAALYQLASGHLLNGWAAVAYLCATIKFTIVAVALGSIIVCGLVYLTGRFRNS